MRDKGLHIYKAAHIQMLDDGINLDTTKRSFFCS